MPVLADVTLDVAEGEFLAIVGPSGCGKSTLLNIVSGLFPPSTRHVSVNGVPVQGINPRIAPRLRRWRPHWERSSIHSRPCSPRPTS
ncbi:MAG: ATP-binding cassette domain-containing protein [candidate division NC10 bacterium]|nr:ATP-binding cassette domain-containing protein [candidate division NC10 bacterium]